MVFTKWRHIRSLLLSGSGWVILHVLPLKYNSTLNFHWDHILLGWGYFHGTSNVRYISTCLLSLTRGVILALLSWKVISVIHRNLVTYLFSRGMYILLGWGYFHGTSQSEVYKHFFTVFDQRCDIGFST